MPRITQLGQRRHRPPALVDGVRVPALQPGTSARLARASTRSRCSPHSAASRSTAASRRRAAARSPTRISCQVRLFWATAMSRIRPCRAASAQHAPRPARGPRRAADGDQQRAEHGPRLQLPGDVAGRRNVASAARAAGNSSAPGAVLGREPGRPRAAAQARRTRVGVGGTRVGQQPPQPLPPDDVPPAEPPPAGQRRPPAAARSAGRRSAAWASAALMSLVISSSRCTASDSRGPTRSRRGPRHQPGDHLRVPTPDRGQLTLAGRLLDGVVTDRVEQPEPERPGAADAEQAQLDAAGPAAAPGRSPPCRPGRPRRRASPRPAPPTSGCRTTASRRSAARSSGASRR